MTDKSDAEGKIRRLQGDWDRHPAAALNVALEAVGPGWRPLVAVAWAAVRSGGGQIQQVKERLGKLWIHYDLTSTEHASEIKIQVSRLVAEADRTCEWCGRLGELRDDDYAAALPIADLLRRNWWYKTLCDEHAWRFYVDAERWYASAWKEKWNE